jgi:hypothetical protein
MSSLFDYRPYEMDFSGKKVSMEIRPLKSREMMVILPLVMKINERIKSQQSDPALKSVIRFNDEESISLALSLQDKVKDIVPSAVRNMSGIDDPWTTICEEFFYFPFVLQIVMMLVSISQIGEAESKNSDRLSGGTT